MSDSRWANVYPDGPGRDWYNNRKAADLHAAPDRLYVLRFDLDDEGDRDTITQETI